MVATIKKTYAGHTWLPFRMHFQRFVRGLRSRRNEFELRFKEIRSTKPLKCNHIAKTQMHILTCHKHVSMFLTSAKSLLRFKPDIVIVLHDDGSLTTKDIAEIEHHIVGVRIIRRADADILADRALAGCPKTRAYRAQVINSLELTDHILLSNGEKIIITNSDTLFLRRPDALLKWIDAPDCEVLCVHEKEPYQQSAFLARVGSNFPPHVTLGLACFPRYLVDAAEIEKLVAQADESTDPWYLGQNMLPALLGIRVLPEFICFLDPILYQASGLFTDGAVYRHYWSSLAILNDQFFADGAQVIAELKAL
jgi:hypothetical protein